MNYLIPLNQSDFAIANIFKRNYFMFDLLILPLNNFECNVYSKLSF